MSEEAEEERKAGKHALIRRLIAWGVLVLVVSFFVIICIRVGKPLVELVSDNERFKQWLDGFGVWSYLVFVFIMMFQAIAAFIPGGPFQMAGGYAFGPVTATLLSITGCGLGSMLVFFLVRRFGEKTALFFISEDQLKKLKFIEESPRWKRLLVLLFIIPGSPKDVFNLFAALTDINPVTWLIVCTLGRIPAIVASAISGDAVSEGRYAEAIVVFLILTATSIAGMIVYRKFENKGKDCNNESDRNESE